MSADSARADEQDRPLVSVVLPAYNGSRTIARTLQSLSNQDYPRTEWIIVDDGSRDELLATVDAFLDAQGRTARIIRHPSNLGISRSLNDGIQAATGEFVLIIHQDIELLTVDWLSRAAAYLESDPNIQVVTSYYGIPAVGEWSFAERAFGLIRRQFHRPPDHKREFVPFSEFKCDLVRKSTVDNLGGFAPELRVAGEDIVLSYQIRRAGGKVLKAYDLQAIQRFTGRGETVIGNLEKEFQFGHALGGVLRTFGAFPFRELKTSPYSRSRSLHRASQPPVALAMLVCGLLFLIPGWLVAGVLLGVLLLARFSYYMFRLGRDFRRSVPGWPRAIAEAALASVLGVMTDFVYSAGVSTGLIRSSIRSNKKASTA